MNYQWSKSDPEHVMWFGVNGFTYNSTRRSPSRGLVREKGWYFYLYIFGNELMIWRSNEII